MSRPSVGLVVFGLAWVVAGACQQADTTRMQLKTLQSQWTSSVAVLRSRHENNVSRLSGFSAPSATDDSERAALYQTADTLQSANRQTLSDFGIQIRQGVDEVEAAIAQGGTAPADVLGDVSARMAGHLHTEEESVLAATVAIEKLAGYRTATP